MGCGASQYPTSAQLEATMGRFSLKPAQVQKLWSQFVKHDIDKSMTLDSREFHTLFKEKPSPFVDHLFAKHEKSSTTRLPFNEFVDIVASFCLNDEDEMVKFAFGAFDVDHNEGIKPDEFRRMIDTLKKTTVDFPVRAVRAPICT
jgi:Ca2+-binding EF-hand superfamily protein